MNEDLIEGYFENRLNSSEMETFHNLMQTNPEFSAEVNYQRSLKKVITQVERETLKKQLAGYELSPKEPTVPKPHNNRIKVLAIITTIAAVFLGAIWIYGHTNSTAPETLYASYYESYPNVVYDVTRGTSNADSDVKSAFMAYDQEQYKQALSYFEKSQVINPTATTYFYTAQCHMELGAYQQAVENLIKVQSNDTFFEKSKWYLSLCYLKLGQKEKAITTLKDLVSRFEFKNVEATALLSKLE